MTTVHQQLLDEIPYLSTEKANQVFTFIQFIQYQGSEPNADTIEAIEEAEMLLNDPNAKTYSSFSEILAEVEEELANEI